MKALLFIDTETGGTDPQQTSLLSVGLVAWKNGEITAKKEIFVRENILRVTHQALKTNQIDLRSHFSRALDPPDALQEIITFCEGHFSTKSPITLAGHNIHFDIAFLKTLFERENQSFQSYFSYRSLDTASVLTFLHLAGLIPQDISSSDKAFSYFSIVVDKRHSALGDALATASLFNCLRSLVQHRLPEAFPAAGGLDIENLYGDKAVRFPDTSLNG